MVSGKVELMPPSLPSITPLVQSSHCSVEESSSGVGYGGAIGHGYHLLVTF